MIMLDYFDPSQKDLNKQQQKPSNRQSVQSTKSKEKKSLHPETSAQIKKLAGNVDPMESQKTIEQPSKDNLDWIPYLEDNKTAQDIIDFKNWDKALIPSDSLIEKDIIRTRTDLAEMRDPSVQKALREVAAFYCLSNNVEYQQGLLELIAPFLLSKKKDFNTEECYAYFNAFMRKHFPNILTRKSADRNSQLPHLTTALNFCELMIQYHLPEISDGLKRNMIDVRTFVTSWILTLFIKGTPLSVVYEIFYCYLKREDKLFFFYLVAAMLAMNKKTLVKLFVNNDDNTMLNKYLNQSIKIETLRDPACVKTWFELADSLKRSTPKSFEIHLGTLGFTSDTDISKDMMQSLLNNPKPRVNHVYPSEMVDFLLRRTQKKAVASLDREINFKIVDLRRKKEKNDQCLPCIIDLPITIYEDSSAIKKALKSPLKNEANAHFCLMTTGEEDDELENKMLSTIIEYLTKNNKSYVSTLIGGFKALKFEIEKESAEAIFNRKGEGVFQKFKNLFHK